MRERGELQGIADRIAESLEKVAEEGGIRPEDVPSIVQPAVGEDKFNCYPGFPCHECYDLAVFLSLESRRYKGAYRNHYSFEYIMRLVVRHMQGLCFGKTTRAIILCDSLHPDILEFWKPNLLQIKRTCLLEFYIIHGGRGILVPS